MLRLLIKGLALIVLKLLVEFVVPVLSIYAVSVFLLHFDNFLTEPNPVEISIPSFSIKGTYSPLHIFSLLYWIRLAHDYFCKSHKFIVSFPGFQLQPEEE